MSYEELPLPAHYYKSRIDQVYKVNYQKLAEEAISWRKEHQLNAEYMPGHRICLLLIDCQNTFCTPGFELFVAGRSGNAAVLDSARICEFVYKNIGLFSDIIASMDTHRALQIFHPIFLVDKNGDYPEPNTQISLDDIKSGRYMVNPDITDNFDGQSQKRLQDYLEYYVRQLEQSGRLQLMIWPYHAMLGGIGHALVSAIEEALFFFTMTRQRQPHIEIKGEIPMAENYSIFRPEVDRDENGQKIASENKTFFDRILGYDRILIAGQAKSHCVAWTVEDLLLEIQSRDPNLAEKVYLLEDCSSAVVIPNAVDFTEQAESAFERFARAGMKLVKSTDPISSWPGMKF
ncbi:MAG: isochorismatase [candidate division Zixibacteria bacterium]|nr:isochorismatase [candidate division Zixibacteria bacterium]